MTGKNVLVTGGAGFIGSHLADFAAKVRKAIQEELNRLFQDS